MLVLPVACDGYSIGSGGAGRYPSDGLVPGGAISFRLDTADYLLCRRCGVYVGAVCETAAGVRSVINTRCLKDRVAFTQEPIQPDYNTETTELRLARRAANWMPAVLHLTE